MKLTLWQQFSSNHSAAYTVVGQFENADAAHKAGDQLRDILAQIAAWHRAYYDSHGEYFGLYWDEFPPLTPIEKQLARQYEVETAWKSGVDWAMRDDVVQKVNVFHDLVIVTSFETWHLKQPFSALIARMGGTAFADDYFDTQILVTITCDAPDMGTVNALTAKLEAYFNAVRDKDYETMYTPPWGSRGYATGGKVHVKETRLQLLDLQIRIPDTLDTIMRFLSNQGCKNIAYCLFERHKPQQ